MASVAGQIQWEWRVWMIDKRSRRADLWPKEIAISQCSLLMFSICRGVLSFFYSTSIMDGWQIFYA